jgi:hypothetical protein
VRALFFRFVAADRDDEPGVLGNLPRSRPGQRSAKRASGSAAKRKATAPKSQRTTRTARKPAASRRTAAGTRSAPTPRSRPQAPPRAASRPQGGDPLGQAVQLAGKVASVGLRTAAGIVRRLPMP